MNKSGIIIHSLCTPAFLYQNLYIKKLAPNGTASAITINAMHIINSGIYMGYRSQ
ncbi:MAG: hypothetical protein K2G04_01815 [Oscillospiraceae bacterium]|nr:hypothetical protein [Oscillospiraceae bacterium]